jgi:transcriptional regulator with XRE-family HTH domain
MGLHSSLVKDEERYKSYSAALIAQMNAEIKGDGETVRSIAAKIGVDYNTLRRYLAGDREIPMTVMYAIVDQLSVDESELYRLARARFDRK